jgi:glutathione S-transferase
MKLIGAVTSPYVRKVRIVMAEKKLDYQFVPEDVWSADTTIGQSNPLGKVPCLVMEGGEALFDSRVIVEYLDTLSPVGKLIPAVGRERAEVKTWEALADGVLDAADPGPAGSQLARPHQGPAQPGLDRPPDGKIHASLEAMSKGLGDKPFCSGIHMSLADIAVGCALGYLDFRFPTSTGAPSTPIWPACTKNWPSARASSTANRPEWPPRLLTSCSTLPPEGAAFCLGAARRQNLCLNRSRGA